MKKTTKTVTYSDFGAKGDGKTDDFEAIIQAHAHANENGFPVKAEDDAVYYLSPKNRTITVQTDTDFGRARFIIDDRSAENPRSPVFRVTSKLKPVQVNGISALKKNQQVVDASFPGACIVTVVDSDVKRYIRYGGNQNSGKPQTDIFLVDADGNIDMQAPIIWDFEQITAIKAMPLDSDLLTIRGGHFTTIVDTEKTTVYWQRNIAIRRSNVDVVGLEHYIEGEADNGAPYGGFLNISEAANVTVRDTVLSGHKTFWKIGSAGRRVPMGSYDILVNKAINVSFINCRQTNDINDSAFWGIMGSNYCKNLVYDNCVLSRFDAHMGVANATIRNSTMGYMGINAIGFGRLTIENTTVRSGSFVNMRPDYGSTWQGRLVIRDCVFVPRWKNSARIIGGSNHGGHDFGYTCYLPEHITIDGLRIDDANHKAEYNGPVIFANFNPEFNGKEAYPIVIPKEVVLKNVTTASGKSLRTSENTKMFQSTKITGLEQGH